MISFFLNSMSNEGKSETALGKGETYNQIHDFAPVG